MWANVLKVMEEFIIISLISIEVIAGGSHDFSSLIDQFWGLWSSM
jgi:hypothetical protein